MPWSLIIFISVLFGVICATRLMDHRIRHPYGGSSAYKSAATDVSNKNEHPRSGSVSSGGRCQQIYEDLENKVIVDNYDWKACTNWQRDAVLFEEFSTNNINDESPMMKTINTNRDFLYANLNEFPGSSSLFGANMAAQDTGPNIVDPTLKADRMHYSKSELGAETDYASELYGNKRELDKRENKHSRNVATISCDCKVKNILLDLGQQHFPRYLLHAVCQVDSPNDYPQKCWQGSYCKPLEYQVKVLTFRRLTDHIQTDAAATWLPHDLRPLWKFKTVTIAAGCFCSY